MGPDTTLTPNSAVFDSIWDALARDSRCDERGGAEYERVKAQWMKFGEVNAIIGFILIYANATPHSGLLDDAPSSRPTT